MTDFLMNQTDIMHENPRFSDGLRGGVKQPFRRQYMKGVDNARDELKKI